MGLFNNMLSNDESLFINSIALDLDFQPKLVPYRENHQGYIAQCIKPLLQQRNGKNLIAMHLSNIFSLMNLLMLNINQKSD